jgi:hypothetical protein
MHKENFAGPGPRGNGAGTVKPQENSSKNTGPSKPNQKPPVDSNTNK